jgi:hypothetical protein
MTNPVYVRFDLTHIKYSIHNHTSICDKRTEFSVYQLLFLDFFKGSWSISCFTK